MRKALGNRRGLFSLERRLTIKEKPQRSPGPVLPMLQRRRSTLGYSPWVTAQYESSSMSSTIREWKWPQTSLIITTAPS